MILTKADHFHRKLSILSVFITLILIIASIPGFSQKTVKKTPKKTVKKSVAKKTAPKSEFMFVDEIKPGMKGYGISVFKDNKLERFDVEIIGVMHNAMAGIDMILARLKSPHLKDMGVIAGMSGSPVFLNDRMIGAVAYGWTFSKEPIAGITPIKNMLDVFEETDDKPHPPESAPTEDFLAQFDRNTKSSISFLKMKENISIKTSEIPNLEGTFGNSGKSITFEPLNTPLMVSGAHPAVMKRMRHYFADSGLEPALGGGGKVLNPKLKDKPIENGSGISIPMMSGSMDISAIGTVTYRKDNKLIAFGHPFFEMGNVDIPMASAYIFTTMPSLMRPFKLGASVKEVGAIRQDRRPAIGGFFGYEAPTFDMDVKMKLLRNGKEYKFSYRIWEHQLLSPMLVDLALTQSLVNNDKLFGSSAAKIKYSIELADGQKIEKEDFLSAEFILAFDASLPIRFDIMALMNNSYKKVNIKKLNFEIEILDTFKAVGIETAYVNREVYKPGETVKTKLYFKPYRQPRFSRTVEMKLPDDLRDGTYNIDIMNGMARSGMEYARSPGLGVILSFEGLMENLRISYPSNRLYIMLTEKESGLRLGEKEMPGLPSSVMKATRSVAATPYTSPVVMNFIKEKYITTDFEIRGNRSIRIKVDHLRRR
jgi:SpoIVB peptidase S55